MVPMNTSGQSSITDDQRAETVDSPGPSSLGMQDEDMRLEINRLKTFERWPVTFMDPRQMAAAGFFYTGRADIVKCAFCSFEANNWQEGVNPAEEHRQRAPHCPLLLGMPIGNESADSGDDLVGRTDGNQILPSSGPEMYVNKEVSLEKFGVYRTKGPIHSEYATYRARLATYASWPISLRQQPDKLSDAGFFYTGFGDQTVCFHCGGGLVHWEDDEDPWEEHAMWLSECGYLRLVKGKEFIQEAVSKKNTVLEAQDTSEHMDCDEIPPAVAESSSSSDVSESIPGPSSVDTPSQSSQRATNEFKGTLVDENKKTEDALLCKICYLNNMGVLFLPCGHLMSCTRCAPSLALCPFCRQPITGIIRAYFP